METPAASFAIVILSDPSGGTDEATGRVFNALATARDARERGHGVRIVFLGAGTRWPAELEDPGHRVHGLYADVKPLIAGVSEACAVVFNATEGAEATGLPFLDDHALPGAGGLPSLVGLAEAGHTVITF